LALGRLRGVKVTAEAARRFLVARQLIAPARSLKGGPGAVLEVFLKLGSIQFDPLAIAGRNHDLVLHARVADYNPAWCDELYEGREIFEAYNKGMSLVPVTEFPWFRGILSRNSRQTLADNAEVAKRVLARKVPLKEQLLHKLLSRYRAHGLLGVGGAGDIFGGLGPAKPDPRWPEYEGRHALREELVERGELVPVEVEGLRGKRLVLKE